MHFIKNEIRNKKVKFKNRILWQIFQDANYGKIEFIYCNFFSDGD